MGYGYLNPPLSPLGQGMLNQNPIGLPSMPKGAPTRLPLSPVIGVIAGALLINDVIGQAGGYKWRDDLLAKIGNGKGAQVSNSSTQQLTSGVTYEVFITYTVKQTGETTPPFGIGSIVAPLQGVTSFTAPNAPNGDPSSSGIIVTGATGAVSFAGNSGFYSNFALASLRRSDGQAEPPAQPQRTPTNEGYKPPQDGYLANSASPSAPPATKPPYYNPAFPAAVGAAPSALKNPPSQAPSPKPPEKLKPEKPPLKEPTQPLAPSAPPAPTVSPSSFKPDKPQEPVKPPNQTNDILGKLAQLIGITALINSNTQPAQQRNNAKEGTCDALQSPQCTKGVEDRIKDPIMGNVDATKAQTVANAGAISAIANAIATFYELFQNKIGKVLSFLDNTIVDRAIGAANFAMNVHNALMLSNALGKTLAGVVDNATNLAGFQFTNTEGQRVTASRAFSNNVSAIIINLIGQDLFAELSDDWKVANRIYQSTTNALNKTEKLFAGQSKIAQKSGIDVANIGNALRANGIVNPNSYPPMAATKEANTPAELFSDVNAPLGSFGTAIRNLNAVTKSVSGTLKQVSGIKREFGKLQDLTNKESKIRKSLRSQSAAQAKARAKFTFIQIKTIKATGKR